MLTNLSFAFLEAKRFFVPCPFKWLTGLDCPGCGFQRSVWALFQGEFQESFKLYPPTALFLISFLAASMTYFFKWNSESKILRAIYIATGVLVIANYLYKIAMHKLA